VRDSVVSLNTWRLVVQLLQPRAIAACSGARCCCCCWREPPYHAEVTRYRSRAQARTHAIGTARGWLGDSNDDDEMAW